MAHSIHSISDGYCLIKNTNAGTSLVVQWVRLRVPNAEGLGSIPGQGTRSCMHIATNSPHVATKGPTCFREDPTCCN